MSDSGFPVTLDERRAQPPVENILAHLFCEIADRIGNPLMVVKGSLQLYQEQPEFMPRELISESLLDLESLLLLLRILSRNSPCQPGGRARINRLIEELYPVFEPMMRSRDQWLELYLSRHTGRTEADPIRLKVLLYLLFAYVTEHTCPGGIITLKTAACNSQPCITITTSGFAGTPTIPTRSGKKAGTRIKNPPFQLEAALLIASSLQASLCCTQTEKEGFAIMAALPAVSKR